MKGVVGIVVLAIALMGLCGTVMANPPIVPPVQYEQFCENHKVSGTGIIDVSTSVIDKKIALEYFNTMNGDGDIELDQETAYSQNADKLKRNVSSVNGGNESGTEPYPDHEDDLYRRDAFDRRKTPQFQGLLWRHWCQCAGAVLGK